MTDAETKPCPHCAGVGRMPVVPVVPPDDPEEGEFAWSCDGENFGADTLVDLIVMEETEPGDVVERGTKHRPRASELITAMQVIEQVQDNACGLAGEWAEDYLLDLPQEAGEELEELLAGWMQRHAMPRLRFYSINDVQPYTVTAEDYEEAMS